MIESWRKTWRDGLAPLIATPALGALRDALESDDPRLIQGASTDPLPCPECADGPLEGACALGYCGWQSGLETVAEVEEFFAQLCYGCDLRLGEPAACRRFINWWDDVPRAEGRALLLAEVTRTLDERRAAREAA